MKLACYCHDMGMLQIKNFPDELKEKLAKRAKDQGTTMSALVVDIVWRDLSLPTTAAWVDRTREEMKNERMIDVDTAALIQADRDERERYLTERLLSDAR